MVLLSIFAGAALVLAAIGIYGLMSYSVEQRTQEIGIRMALGANRGAMLRSILREGMTLAIAGVVLGLGLAYGLTRLLASLLFGVKASDPIAFAAVAGVLVAGGDRRRVHPGAPGDDRRSGHRPPVRIARLARHDLGANRFTYLESGIVFSRSETPSRNAVGEQPSRNESNTA